MFNIEFLRSLLPGWRPTKPETALAFILLGSALWLLSNEFAESSRRHRHRLFAYIFAAAVALLGLASIVEHLSASDFGINQALLPKSVQAAVNCHPCQMGLLTGVDLFLLSCAVLLLDVETRRGHRPAQFLALLAALLSMPVLVGFGDTPIFIQHFTSDRRIAIPTASGLAILMLGVFFARPYRGLMALLASNRLSGVMARRLLPAAILLPIALDWAILAGWRAGFYSLEVALAIFVTSVICILGAMISWTTMHLNEIDLQRQRANECLQTSEERYRLLFEVGPNPMWVLDDVTLRFLAVNEAAIRHYGYSRAEFLGMTLRDILSDGDASHPSGSEGRALKDPIRSTEWGHRRKDGTVIEVEIFLRPIHWNDRNAWLVQAHDVTDRKRAQELLRQREERFRQMADNIQEIFWMLDASTKKVIYVSPAYEQICGRTTESLYAEPLSYREVIHEEDRGWVLQKLEDAVASGRFREEFRIVRPDGTVRWVWVNGFMVGEDVAVPRVMVGTVQDISDRKKMEIALRESETNFRALVESAPYGIDRAAPDGTLLMVNPALVKMLGYDSEEELLKVNLERQVYQDPEERRRILELVKRGKQFHAIEAHWRRKDGNPILVRGSGRMIYDKDGNIVCFEAMVEDITQQKALEVQLRQSQKMEAIALLAGGIAHDFNNLLAGILGFGELVLKSLKPGSAEARRVQEIVQAAVQGRLLTNQLLAFSQRQITEPRVVEVGHHLSDLEMMLRRILGDDIRFSLAIQRDLGNISIDPGQLSQLIMNLAVNARDAMPGGGTLRIEARDVDVPPNGKSEIVDLEPGPYVVLSVSDTGCGMDGRTKERIFEPFFSTKPPGRGTGLGLSIVYGIVKQSSAHLIVETAPGHGATFKIYFPRVESTRSKTLLAGPAKEVKARGATILLVEDHELVRNMTTELLRDNGFEVLIAVNGIEALGIAKGRAAPIDLLFSDIVMPDVTGIELAKKIKQSHPETKVLLMTGYADNRTIPFLHVKEAHAFIGKPFNEGELLAKITEILSLGLPDPASAHPSLPLGQPAAKRNLPSL